MAPWRRKFGLGRLVYHAWHLPRAKIRESIRSGGPREQWRTEQGRREMEAAAHRLPALPAPAAAPSTEVHVLTGKTLWYQTAFLLHSLARFHPVRAVVHDDGTLAGPALTALGRILPHARFVTAAEAESTLDRVLPRPRYPVLRRRRSELVLFRKLMDIHAGAAGWRLFLDSDMLFFRPPLLLQEWLRGPDRAIHLLDVGRAYGYEMGMLEALAGGPVPDLVNTGILGLRSDAIDWDRMERDCRSLIERSGTHYYQEQALSALQLAGQAHSALPRPDYLVCPAAPEAADCRAILHHYVAGSKAPYFRQNWRRILPGLAA